MVIKSISSTTAQNNFGQVLEDVAQNQIRYIVERRGIAKAVILGLEDFSELLNNVTDQERLQTILKEVRPQYQLGRVLEIQDNQV